MGAIEIASAVALVLGAVAYCCVKVIGQIESNKFKICKCCGNECVRDVEPATQIVDVDRPLQGVPNTRNAPTITTEVFSPRLPNYPRSRPTLQVIQE